MDSIKTFMHITIPFIIGMTNQLNRAHGGGCAISLGVHCTAGNIFPRYYEPRYQIISLLYAVLFVGRNPLDIKEMILSYWGLLRENQLEYSWSNQANTNPKRKALECALQCAQKCDRKVTHREIFLALIRAGTPKKEAGGKLNP